MLSSKDNFTIEEIKIPDSEMEMLNKVLKSTVATKSKSYKIRAVMGGTCSSCFGVPKYKVIYDVVDSKLVDRYCEKCLTQHKSELVDRLKNMNFT